MRTRCYPIRDSKVSVEVCTVYTQIGIFLINWLPILLDSTFWKNTHTVIPHSRKRQLLEPNNSTPVQSKRTHCTKRAGAGCSDVWPAPVSVGRMLWGGALVRQADRVRVQPAIYVPIVSICVVERVRVLWDDDQGEAAKRQTIQIFGQSKLPPSPPPAFKFCLVCLCLPPSLPPFPPPFPSLSLT